MTILKSCRRCGGEARIYNTAMNKKGDWVAECKQCNNEYHGCDVKQWTVREWNRRTEK